MDISKITVKEKTKATKRRGRGTGTTLGKTGGRGHKGAGQRAGKKLPYVGFNGGNLPYYRKIPKRGFTPPNRKECQIVNLSDIEKRIKGEKEVNPEILFKVNLIKDTKKTVKILAKMPKEFSLKAIFKVDKFSKKAKEAIEACGGKAEILLREPKQVKGEPKK
ncbi:MAG: 50S ribosomal protein L15 [Candidatus Omnitrophica bacterium]|nr:50S ribosomal protein L15 [Candidatus Omnitrophota bacterium]